MDGISVDFARPQDFDVLFEFMQTYFRVNEPITGAINSSYIDTFKFYKDIVSGDLKVPFTSLVARNRSNEVVGIALNTVYYYDDLSQASCDIDQKEFSGMITEGPYDNRNANRLVVFIDFVENGLFKHVSPWAKIFKIDILAVRSDQMGKGLGSHLLNLSIDLASRHQCTHIGTCATAQASQRLFMKKGFKTIKEVCFCDFLDNGIPVFSGVFDKGRSAKLMLLSFLY